MCKAYRKWWTFVDSTFVEKQMFSQQMFDCLRDVKLCNKKNVCWTNVDNEQMLINQFRPSQMTTVVILRWFSPFTIWKHICNAIPHRNHVRILFLARIDQDITDYEKCFWKIIILPGFWRDFGAGKEIPIFEISI